jgi:transcriptional regulator with PAS, ATPase and Fis domain
VVMASETTVQLADLPDYLVAHEDKPSREPPGFSEILAETERHLLEKALAKHGGNRTATASELGINRRTLYKKLKARQPPS